MSRSGYSDDGEYVALWRAAVSRALYGKRGQAFLREMAASLDGMAVKELIRGEIVQDDEHVCAIGAVAVSRKMDVSDLDMEDGAAVGDAFGVAMSFACEVAYMNDEAGPEDETPSERWQRMRKWVAEQIVVDQGALFT